MAGEVLALAPGFRALHGLHGRVDDAALIRVHRLERRVAPGFYGAGRHLLAEVFERLLALFAVVADVQRHAVVRLVHVVRHEGGEVLERVERLAAVADDKADILAGQNQLRAGLDLVDLDLDIRQPHTAENGTQVRCRRIGRRLADKRAHLRGAAAEQAKALFLRQLENFKFRLCRVHAELRARVGMRLFNRCARCNCFFYHCFLHPFDFQYKLSFIPFRSERRWDSRLIISCFPYNRKQSPYFSARRTFCRRIFYSAGSPAGWPAPDFSPRSYRQSAFECSPAAG